MTPDEFKEAKQSLFSGKGKKKTPQKSSASSPVRATSSPSPSSSAVDKQDVRLCAGSELTYELNAVIRELSGIKKVQKVHTMLYEWRHSCCEESSVGYKGGVLHCKVCSREVAPLFIQTVSSESEARKWIKKIESADGKADYVPAGSGSTQSSPRKARTAQTARNQPQKKAQTQKRAWPQKKAGPNFSFWMEIDEDAGNELLGAFRECSFLAQQGWSAPAIADISAYITNLMDGMTTTPSGDETLFHVTSEVTSGKKINDVSTIISSILSHNKIKYRIEVRDSADGEPETTIGDFKPQY